MQINADMNRIVHNDNRKKDNGIEGKPGLFHMLSQEMKNSLLIVARQDRDKVRKYDASTLEKERAAKEKKEEMLKNVVWKKCRRHTLTDFIITGCLIPRHVGELVVKWMESSKG